MIRSLLRRLVFWALAVPLPADDDVALPVYLDRPVTGEAVAWFLRELALAEAGERPVEGWAAEFEAGGLMPGVCRRALRLVGSAAEITDEQASAVPAAQQLRAFRRVYAEALGAVAVLGGARALAARESDDA